MAAAPSDAPPQRAEVQVTYRQYEGEEHDMALVQQLVDPELSEPYSIFTYRYFLQQWPELCYFACDGGEAFGVVVGKLEPHKSTGAQRGYIGMLVVTKPYRGLGVGKQLVRRLVEGMRDREAEEVVLEAEVSNAGALALYESLGFVRDKRLQRYYLSGTDAYRLKLLLPLTPAMLAAHEMQRLAFEQGAAQADSAQQHAPAQPDGPHAHGAECCCQRHGGGEGGANAASPAEPLKEVGDDTAVANGSESAPSQSAASQKRKQARKSKSRRR